MGGDVNTRLSVVADNVVFTSGVRLPARRVVFDRVIVRSDSAVQLGGAAHGWWVRRVDRHRADRLDRPVCIEAVALFFREEREPTFYLGFIEPLLRSVLRGGIA